MLLVGRIFFFFFSFSFILGVRGARVRNCLSFDGGSLKVLLLRGGLD